MLSPTEVYLRGSGLTSPRVRERLIERLQDAGISDERVLRSMRRTPRHLFVEEAFSGRAYEDTALPIGHGQTISQPYTVARMSEAILRDGVPNKVLEIGTGSGYQTAILADLTNQVFSIERIKSLQDLARERLRVLDRYNVRLRHADGWQGWSAHGPFDAILVAAAPDEIPPRLLEQIAEGGRMVIPVGPQGGVQRLLMIRRVDGVLREEILEGASFVPLIAGAVA
ncbi:MAG: protein-L-isoaspartate(D-aspartate) O-methyltransferase [Halothiobacillaceae bacterium]|nr:MAG: protein-L-isoaspartate(D-aspartate) O-methyltransferase [Halothiobacillaceae bacterium]